ncbi:hypothetical protein O0I10_007574 [Lichtheimia ornata]|uniref:Uncharacterized protein n=1 Tax=Lichtheimia ornata TaxID=688661 RepID=A0AAD7V070_9FUNG|nr:uncharacterized protein O0I10_007574 [Lichtheimia ornata]KAJ8656727.1 hypothetical protein O0I10_007574 [Lichtheimia ornata]
MPSTTAINAYTFINGAYVLADWYYDDTPMKAFKLIMAIYINMQTAWALGVLTLMFKHALPMVIRQTFNHLTLNSFPRFTEYYDTLADEQYAILRDGTGALYRRVFQDPDFLGMIYARINRRGHEGRPPLLTIALRIEPGTTANENLPSTVSLYDVHTANNGDEEQPPPLDRNQVNNNVEEE